MSYICVDDQNPQLALQTLEFCQREFPLDSAHLITSHGIQDTNLVKVRQLPTEFRINSIEYYSYFMSILLHNYIETDKVICVQTDGYVLNPSAWTDEFLEYDYIGAPWTVGYNKHPNFPDCTEDTTVGNGGFSLRSRKLLKLSSYYLTQYKQPYHPEDLAICRGIRSWLDNEDIKFAPREVAKLWAAEDSKYTGQFGFHGKITMKLNNIPFLNGTSI